MTFVEMLLLIQSRGEVTEKSDIHSFRTDKHMYVREGGTWVEKEIPPPIEEVTIIMPPTKEETK